MGPTPAALGKIVSESPSSYNLYLPRNSSLAAITSDYDWNDPYERPAIASEKQTKKGSDDSVFGHVPAS